MIKKAVIGILFLLSVHFASAQLTKQRVKIMQVDSSIAVPYANIQIKNKSAVFMADENGFAMLDLANGDTIVINALGYYSLQTVYSINQSSPVLRIYLLPRNIKIQEVTIRGIRTKDDLKMAILRMRIEEKQRDLPGLKSYHGPLKRPPAGPLSPISMIYESEWAKKKRAKKWSKSIIMPQIK